MTAWGSGEWVAFFVNGDHRRYLRMPGGKRFRGMYANRRAVGYDKAEWTSDIEDAYRFRSPSAAKRRDGAFYPARPSSIQFAKLGTDTVAGWTERDADRY